MSNNYSLRSHECIVDFIEPLPRKKTRRNNDVNWLSGTRGVISLVSPPVSVIDPRIETVAPDNMMVEGANLKNYGILFDEPGWIRIYFDPLSTYERHILTPEERDWITTIANQIAMAFDVADLNNNFTAIDTVLEQTYFMDPELFKAGRYAGIYIKSYKIPQMFN